MRRCPNATRLRLCARRLNDLVYAVDGGMEDWAYASSWDTTAVQACVAPGYPTERTQYTSDMLRVFNVRRGACELRRARVLVCMWLCVQSVGR